MMLPVSGAPAPHPTPISISPFGNFHPVEKIGPIKIGSEQQDFYNSFFKHLHEMLVFCETRVLAGARFTLYKTALQILTVEEKQRESKYQTVFQQGKVRLTAELKADDSNKELKVEVRALWDAQRFVEEEAGISTSVSLKDSLRVFRFMTEVFPKDQQNWLLELPELLKKFEVDPAKLKDHELARLNQVDNHALIEAYVRKMRADWGIKNNIKLPPSNPSEAAHLINEQVLSRLSNLVFEALARKNSNQGDNETNVAYMLAYIFFFIEALNLRIPNKGAQTSPRALRPSRDIIQGLQACDSVFQPDSPKGKEDRFNSPRTHGSPRTAPAANQPGGFAQFFSRLAPAKPVEKLPKSLEKKIEKKSIPVKPKFKPAATVAEGHFYEGLKQLHALLREFQNGITFCQRKASTPQVLIPEPSQTRGTLIRETSTVHLGSRLAGLQSPRNNAWSELRSMVEVASTLVDQLVRELEPKAKIEVPPTLPIEEPEKLFEPTHPKLLDYTEKLYTILWVFEQIILRHIEIHDAEKPTGMIIYFFKHLQEMEEKENKELLDTFKQRITQFEAEKADLKLKQPVQYTQQLAQAYFSTQIEISKAVYPPKGCFTLHFLQDDLCTPVADRFFRNLLNRTYDGKPPSISLEAFIQKIRVLSMSDAIKINTGLGTIVSLASIPEANVIEKMLVFLNEEKKRILTPFRHAKIEAKDLHKKYAELPIHDFEILMLNALLDAYTNLQNVRRSQLFANNTSPILNSKSSGKYLKTIKEELGQISSVQKSASNRPPSVFFEKVVNDVRMLKREEMALGFEQLANTGEQLEALLKANEKLAERKKKEAKTGKEQLIGRARSEPDGLIRADQIIALDEIEQEASRKVNQVFAEKNLRRELKDSFKLVRSLGEMLFKIPLPRASNSSK